MILHLLVASSHRANCDLFQFNGAYSRFSSRILSKRVLTRRRFMGSGWLSERGEMGCRGGGGTLGQCLSLSFSNDLLCLWRARDKAKTRVMSWMPTKRNRHKLTAHLWSIARFSEAFSCPFWIKGSKNSNRKYKDQKIFLTSFQSGLQKLRSGYKFKVIEEKVPTIGRFPDFQSTWLCVRTKEARRIHLLKKRISFQSHSLSFRWLSIHLSICSMLQPLGTKHSGFHWLWKLSSWEIQWLFIMWFSDLRWIHKCNLFINFELRCSSQPVHSLQ